MPTRRTMLGAMIGAVPAVSSALAFAASTSPRTTLGVCLFSYGTRSRAPQGDGPHFTDAGTFLRHCHALGAAGVQVGVGSDVDAARKIRADAEKWGMFVEGQLSLPRTDADVAKFEADLLAAKEAGADVVRTAMLGGRRYETFDSADAFAQFRQQSWKSLSLAEPLVTKHRVKLAIENHKDWRIDEMLDLLSRTGSESIGVCVDTGNSISLLEEPHAVVEAYAKRAFSVHLKDMGVQESPDGFLLSEVPFGDGFLDLKRMIDALRRANPKIRFNLEMITRDPLSIPCLTDKYWATMDKVPGRDLARTLSMVRAHVPSKPLPRISHLDAAGKLRAEDDNVRLCLARAGQFGL